MKVGTNYSFLINLWKTEYQGKINPSTQRAYTPAQFCKSNGLKYNSLIRYIGKRNTEYKGYGNLLTPEQIQAFVASMQQQGIESPILIRQALETKFQLTSKQAYHQYTTVIKKVMGSNEEDRERVPKPVQKLTQKKSTIEIPSTKTITKKSGSSIKKSNTKTMYDSSFNEFNYLYFQYCADLKQRLITSDGCKAGHPLLSYQTRDVKDRYNSILGALEYVEVQVNLELSNNMLYISPDLSAKAHGDHPTSDKQRVDEIISKANITTIDIPRSVHVQHIREIGFHLYRAGYAPATSKFLNTVSDDLKREVFQYFTSPDATVHSAKDDDRDNGDSKRYNIGFTQGQKLSPRYMDKNGIVHDDIKIPYCHYDVITKMPPLLRQAIGNILLASANAVKENYPNAFDDTLRHELVQAYYTKRCWPDLDIPWEYINISIKKYDAVLQKHFDTLNDSRLNYNHAAVFSFFINDENNVRFRVTIVMTTRKSIGSICDKIRKL